MKFFANYKTCFSSQSIAEELKDYLVVGNSFWEPDFSTLKEITFFSDDFSYGIFPRTDQTTWTKVNS